jgi:hypothetical protein
LNRRTTGIPAAITIASGDDLHHGAGQVVRASRSSNEGGRWVFRARLDGEAVTAMALTRGLRPRGADSMALAGIRLDGRRT